MIFHFLSRADQKNLICIKVDTIIIENRELISELQAQSSTVAVVKATITRVALMTSDESTLNHYEQRSLQLVVNRANQD